MGLFDDLIPSAAAPGADGGNPNVPRITVRPNRDIPASGRALLDTIAGSESPGYDTMYGGGKFQDFTDHPRQAVPIQSGPNAGKTSSAAGRYQFLGSTWDQVKQEAGLPDFSPDSQDQGAWHLAQKTYQQKTGGRDLAADLENAKGNPNAISGIGKMLSGTWTSLPGGIEPNRATGSFAQRYNGAQQPTDMSSQAKRPAGGLFDDLIPQAAQGQPAPSDPMADNGGQFAAPLASGQNIRTAREGQSPPVATAGEAAASGFVRSGTFNFIDELEGLAAAGGLDPNNPKHDEMTAALAILKGAYRRTMGDKEADAAYRVKVSEMRQKAADQQQFQPGASLGGEIAGGLATAPFTGGAGGAGLGARALQGARIGAVQGGLSGIGEGTDLQSRATGGALGAATGAAIGAVAPAAIEGAVQTARLAAKPFQGVAQAIRGIRDPEAEAARRVTGALQRDVKTAGGPPGLTAPEFAGSVNAGGPAALVDVGGETTRALARSAANTSPEARATLNATINNRFESQSDRVTGWLNKTFGPSDTGATREALQQQARAANKPAYTKAYGDKNAQSLWDGGFEQIAQAPVVQEAIKGATKTGANRAAAEGFTPVRNPFVFDEATQRMALKDPNVKPNLQFWDHVKRNLDDTITTLERQGSNSAAADAKQLRGALVDHLDNLVPSFKDARAGAARFFGANDALEAGTKFLSSNQPINDARRAFAQMSTPEKQLFREGFVQSLTQKIEATGDRRNVLNSIAQSPRARQQMELAMGPQGAREFEAMMRVEGVMDLARGAVQGNSTTARQLAELGLAGGAYGIGSGGDIMNPNPSALATAALVYGVAKGKGVIDQRVARHIGEMLVSNDPKVLKKGINIVARNQNMLNALRSFDNAVVSGGSQQGRGILPAQAGAIGRADDNQNDVPRPPGQ
jgi:muramidase (phage lysozyme)